MLIAENDDVILENYQKVANLLTITFAPVSALVPEDSGITPQ